jgi:hypothetical protein
MNTARVTRYAVMTRAVDVTGTSSDTASCGAAVVTIVPSRISMKKHAATSSAMWRRRRSVMVGPLRAPRHHITPGKGFSFRAAAGWGARPDLNCSVRRQGGVVAPPAAVCRDRC